MHPQTCMSDLPSTHDITNYIHNSFVKFISTLKERFQVWSLLFFFTLLTLSYQGDNIGRISTTTDLWSVDQTKASFLGITAHWIKIKSPGSWALCSEVVAFKGIAGAHNGENLGRYFVGLCKWAGIVGDTGTKVNCLFSS